MDERARATLRQELTEKAHAVRDAQVTYLSSLWRDHKREGAEQWRMSSPRAKRS